MWPVRAEEVPTAGSWLAVASGEAEEKGSAAEKLPKTSFRFFFISKPFTEKNPIADNLVEK